MRLLFFRALPALTLTPVFSRTTGFDAYPLNVKNTKAANVAVTALSPLLCFFQIFLKTRKALLLQDLSLTLNVFTRACRTPIILCRNRFFDSEISEINTVHRM